MWMTHHDEDEGVEVPAPAPEHLQRVGPVTDEVPAPNDLHQRVGPVADEVPAPETMLKKDDDQPQLVGPVSDKLLIYAITEKDSDFIGLGVEPEDFLFLRDFLRSDGDKIQERQSDNERKDPMEKPNDDILEELTFEKLTEKYYSNKSDLPFNERSYNVGNGESYLGLLRSQETVQIHFLRDLCDYRQQYNALPHEDDQLWRQFIRDWLEVDIDHQLLREELNSLMHKYKKLKNTDRQGTNNAFVTLGDKIWQADDH